MALDKAKIRDQLQTAVSELTAWFRQQPDESFASGPDEAWSAGQHLHHLIKSTRSLGHALGVPKFLLRVRFGKWRNDSRSYDYLVAFYQSRLAQGARATGRYIPREVLPSEKDGLLSRFRQEGSLLLNGLQKWDESQLDHYRMPHPLLDLLTVREMLYFTIYHTQHHGRILEQRYE